MAFKKVSMHRRSLRTKKAYPVSSEVQRPGPHNGFYLNVFGVFFAASITPCSCDKSWACVAAFSMRDNVQTNLWFQLLAGSFFPHLSSYKLWSKLLAFFALKGMCFIVFFLVLERTYGTCRGTAMLVCGCSLRISPGRSVCLLCGALLDVKRQERLPQSF